MHNRLDNLQSIDFLFLHGSFLFYTDFLAAVVHKQVECKGHGPMVIGQDSRLCGTDFNPRWGHWVLG